MNTQHTPGPWTVSFGGAEHAATREDALANLPADARLSTTFGYPGMGGYAEYHRTPDGRCWVITNGSYLAYKPFVWECRPVEERKP